MKYMFLLMFITVILYGVYHGTDKVTRKKAIKQITYHGFRLGGFLAVIALLAAAAYYLPVSNLI